MQHLQKEITHSVPLHNMNPPICLSVDSSIQLHHDASVPMTYKLEVMLFIALREKIPYPFVKPVILRVAKNLST